jgi:DNA-binding transcriptional MerR regulator
MELVKITDLTNQLSISSRTLRYYEQMGLIQSERMQFEKYRFYDNENIERIKQIIVLRKMQIPIKDIINIYKSQDMTVLVESFVTRINAIDNEIEALRELKLIVDEFLQAMLESGIKHISALPLLYEKIDTQLDAQENRENKKEISFERLSALSEKVSAPLDLIIIDLPPMRVLSSKPKDSDISDVDGFWDWLGKSRIPFGRPGSHKLFEYQKDNVQTVIIQNIDRDFNNDSPYSDYEFEGGLFAVGGVYVEDDIASFHQRMINSFDNNPYYEVDYRHGGRLRHESLAESVISPDSRREKINIFLPVKRRLPDTEHFDPNEQLFDISFGEIENANPVLYKYNIPLTDITPIYEPHYKMLETGEAEYICWISARMLSTSVSVKIPFRVDIEFKVENENERFGYGSDEGSIRFYHGNNLFGINMENNADCRLSKEAICFIQPGLGKFFSYPKFGRIKYNEYNTLTWIVGEKHFAVVINGEVRYCGVNFPYMVSDLYLSKPETIIIGSNGQGKKYFRSIAVSQLKTTPKIKIKQGELIMTIKQSNNIIPNIHQLITMHYGENYWFNGCAKYVMECLGEKDYDYSFFAGLTGDNFAQVYSYDRFRGDGATDYFLSDKGNTEFIENIFAACGYASTFVSIKQLTNNKEMYLQTLLAYIDKGIPVIFNHWGNNPRNRWGWGVFVGYEEFGKTLLYMTADITEPDNISFNDLFPDEYLAGQEACNGWVFVGEKRKNIDLADIYRNRILTLPKLLTTKTEGYCFGAEAFRSWATDIENGRFDNMKPEEFDNWPMYTIYVCNLATNSSCCHDFLDKAQKLNPNLKLIEEIRALYKKMGLMWNNQNGEDLEAIGGGFNITLEALQDKHRRNKIAAKIREFAEYTDKVIAALSRGLKET